MRQLGRISDSRVPGVAAFVLCCLAAGVCWCEKANSGGAELDAERKVAAQLVRDGKLNEAQGLLEKIVKSDSAGYHDFLALGHLYEKQNKSLDAARMYARVLDMVPAQGTSEDEHAARIDAIQRRKQLDPQGPKIDAAVDDFLKKLDALRLEAAVAGNRLSGARLDRLKVAVLDADGRNGGTTVEVAANQPWQSTGLRVVAGQKFRVRASGVWTVVRGDPSFTSDADGVKTKPKFGEWYFGTLLGSIDGKEPFGLGTDATFTANESGTLYLQINDDANANGLDNNDGKLSVLITRN